MVITYGGVGREGKGAVGAIAVIDRSWQNTYGDGALFENGQRITDQQNINYTVDEPWKTASNI